MEYILVFNITFSYFYNKCYNLRHTSKFQDFRKIIRLKKIIITKRLNAMSTVDVCVNVQHCVNVKRQEWVQTQTQCFCLRHHWRNVKLWSLIHTSIKIDNLTQTQRMGSIPNLWINATSSIWRKRKCTRTLKCIMWMDLNGDVDTNV